MVNRANLLAADALVTFWEAPQELDAQKHISLQLFTHLKILTILLVSLLPNSPQSG